MKINIKKQPEKVSFDTLDEGVVFAYNNSFYLKLSVSPAERFNTVNLRYSTVSWFDGCELVEIVRHAQIVGEY